MRAMISKALAGVSAIGILSGMGTGAAAARDVDQSNEIIVSAQKRDQTINDVPISIAALDTASLEARSIQTIADVAAYTPGLDFGLQGTGTGYANRNIISLRGVASTAGASTTGIYIDDYTIQARSTSFQVAGSLFPRVYDLERVEVLRGPQGTLFGAGAQGGVVRFITPEPSLTDVRFSAHGELSTTRYGDENYEIGFSGGAPIVGDVLGFRASIWTRRDGGYVDRVNYQTGETFENANSSDSYVGKISFLFEPTEGVRIKPGVYFQKIETNDTSSFWDDRSSPSDGIFIAGEALQQPSNDQFVMPTLDVDIAPGSLALESRTGYLHRKFDIKTDYTQLSPELSGFGAYPMGGTMRGTQSQDQKIFSQEVRLRNREDNSSLNWLIGVYYSNSKQTDRTAINGEFLDQLFVNAFGIGIADFFGEPLVDGVDFVRGFSTFEEQSLAGFGQIDYKITPNLTITAGARVARTKVKLLQLSEGPLSGYTPDSGSSVDTAVTPKFTLTYDVDDDNMVYATFAMGYRPGGVNASVPKNFTTTCADGIAAIGGTGSTPPPYESDRTYSYEVGSKNRLLDRRLTLNASAYYVDWKDVQQFLAVPNCAGVGYYGNFGNARTYGFDIQMQANLARGLSLGANFGMTNARFTTTTTNPGGQIVVAEGDTILGPNPLTGSATGILPWTLSANLDYDFALSAKADGFIYLDVRHQPHNGDRYSAMFNPLSANYDPELRFAPALTTVGLKVGARLNNWELSLFADNLLNSTPVMGRSRNVAPVPGHPWLGSGSEVFWDSTIRPRTIGISATYRVGD